MLHMNKIKPVACALAVCLALTAACFAAYTAVLAAGTDIPVLSAGTNIAETYLSIAVKEPAGDENGCSPLEISYTIDCAALKKQAGADAKIVTTISYMPSAAGDADAAAYALREAECAIDGAAAAVECSGEGFGCRLTFVTESELPEDGLFTYTASVELGWTEEVCALFAANAEGLLNIQAYAQRV